MESFPLAAESVPQARDYAAEQLRHIAPEAREIVLLVVSELTTNAVRHAGTGFRLKLEPLPGGSLRIAVEDGGAGAPVFRAPDPLTAAAYGRGLLIVDALSSAWGVEPLKGSTGKVVWAIVAAGTDGELMQPDPVRRNADSAPTPG